jgi:hypothetical protein
MSSFNTFVMNNMSSSNAAVQPEPTTITPGCERGYLAAPTIDLIPADLPVVEQIQLAFQIVDAYFVYHCLVIHPSPAFAVPAEYQELLASLGPAADEHILRIQQGIRYCVNSESFFWNSHRNPLAGIPYIAKPTSNALRAVMSHWDCHSAMTRILLELHDYFNPSAICMMRSSSGPPSGSDNFIYHGSYLHSLERCLGYRRGASVNYHEHKETGGVDGFLRSLGRERVLPGLVARVDELVATYKAQPISQFEPIFQRLGAPRNQYTLTPPPIDGEPTETEQAVLDFWQPIVNCFEARDCMGSKVVDTLKATARSIPALKKDAEAGYYLNLLARLVPSGRVPIPDIAGLIVSFIAARLVDDAPELQLRPRLPMYTTEAIDVLAAQTQYMISSNCV